MAEQVTYGIPVFEIDRMETYLGQLKFCTDSTEVKDLREGLTNTKSAQMAVAYWGANATRELGIEKANGSKVRVICDLFSGCCNPGEMRKLLKSGVTIRSLDKYHGKVYVIDSFVFVGSSNASANGLCFEGAECSGYLEVNARITDAKVIEAARIWFDELWHSKRVSIVSEDVISSVEALWAKKQGNKERAEPTSLLSALDRVGPEVRILYYPGEDLSKGAQRTFNQSGRHLYSANSWDEGTEWPIYEDDTGWAPRPGAIFLDFAGSAPKAEFGGIWKIRNKNCVLPVGNSKMNRIILADKLATLNGIPFSRSEIRKIRDALKKFVMETGCQPSKKNHYNYVDEPLVSWAKRIGLA